MYKDIPLELQLSENKISILTIESADYLSDFVQNLVAESQGQTGNISLIDGINECSFTSMMDIIWNPFTISLTDKKTITALYKTIATIADDALSEDYYNYVQVTNTFLDKIEEVIPYGITADHQMSFESLLKLTNVRFSEPDDMDYTERLIHYMKIKRDFCKTEVFFFFELRKFLTEERLLEFYKNCVYEKLIIIILEGSYTGKNEYENVWIIDKDKCILEL